MAPDLIRSLAGLGIEITARLEVEGTVVRVHVERVRLGPVPVPVSAALAYVRKALEGRPGFSVESRGRTMLLDLNRMNPLGPGLTVKAIWLKQEGWWYGWGGRKSRPAVAGPWAKRGEGCRERSTGRNVPGKSEFFQGDGEGTWRSGG